MTVRNVSDLDSTICHVKINENRPNSNERSSTPPFPNFKVIAYMCKQYPLVNVFMQFI